MGTGGTKNSWARDANVIVERLNRALNVMAFELGGGDPPKIQSVGSGVFRLKALGRTWRINVRAGGQMTKPPSQLEPLVAAVLAKFPDTEVRTDGPTAGGYWFVDFSRPGKDVNLEWRPEAGYGVSFPPFFPFTGPDEVHAEEADALAAILRGLGG